jgi:hypothetical protein
MSSGVRTMEPIGPSDPEPATELPGVEREGSELVRVITSVWIKDPEGPIQRASAEDTI